MPAGKIKKSICKALDMPEDVIFDLPKIVMNGDVEISCGNYGGIIEYSTSLIKLYTGQKKLCIEGSALLIRNIDPDEIIISGKIKTVSFI